MSLDAIIATVAGMNRTDLSRLQSAVERRRAELRQSGIIERRPFANGVLQSEYRAYPKTGTRRGPYWYFKWREGGRQRTEYIGKDLETWMQEKQRGEQDG